MDDISRASVERQSRIVTWCIFRTQILAETPFRTKCDRSPRAGPGVARGAYCSLSYMTFSITPASSSVHSARRSLLS
ncbi:hypothetical protein HETIRDRAFT_436311 [Heterobasidion irregulare TC 32-1]|uniref:Uncharacterized protein n=1 Tax=Heterobasidion irregulare (strain TC 32-1) TaxID=747525 RepID=W4JV94_HETIT|nr:uncharacterized protein HETIRDRAFT_436311 [Heterobasidion irregulare TC 32-1]ETW77462.1 hypothetical protein HETIRDRAFT_436311 [Heterobasidion irregulare TC 32-1]